MNIDETTIDALRVDHSTLGLLLVLRLDFSYGRRNTISADDLSSKYGMEWKIGKVCLERLFGHGWLELVDASGFGAEIYRLADSDWDEK